MDDRDLDGPADAALPRAALARLALSAAAKEVADRAMWLVPVPAEPPPDARHVEEAARLVTAAQAVLTQAVVHARESGASWSSVSSALNVTRQAAHLRFSDAVSRWRAALDQPWTTDDDGMRCELPKGADLPDQHMRALDLWCHRHINPEIEARQGFPVPLGSGAHMVSDNLPQHTEETRRATAERFRRS
ncbi:hypothetical protein [Fodinicola acaciae]|uniref:hypothetical protein n=1 Tax=Fodinicola acaciae TaxID=2681555 RepID=UPI0013D87C51|nr:hypothetical protein [Fodinicola acaciae]